MAIVRIDALRSLDYTGISGTYAAVGSALTRNWRMFKITNNTNGDMLFSLDGTTDNIFVPAGGFTLYDLSTNALNVSDSDWFVMEIASQFYVRELTNPSQGGVYIEGVYSTGV